MSRLREVQHTDHDGGDSDDEQDYCQDTSHGFTLLIVGSKNAREWMVIDEARKTLAPWAASPPSAARVSPAELHGFARDGRSTASNPRTARPWPARLPASSPLVTARPRSGCVLTEQRAFAGVTAQHRRAPVARLLAIYTLGDPGRSSRGRKTRPQRVTGHLSGIKPCAGGKTLQHERHRLTEIAKRAGCSKAYASCIRRGKWTPHVSTWAELAKLVGVEVNAAALLTRPSQPSHRQVGDDPVGYAAE